jgi:hypothetical protein
LILRPEVLPIRLLGTHREVPVGARHASPLLAALLLTLVLAACDSEPATPAVDNQPPGVTAEPATPTAAVEDPAPTPEAQAPTPGSQATDAVAVAPPTAEEEAPPPTEVTAMSTGPEMTALQALGALRPKALAWQADARLALLSNVRPGQQKNLLSDALGKPEINEPTPNGKGRNWTLVAFSPSALGAIAIGMDGAQTDLVKAGAVSADMVARFAGPETTALGLDPLDVSKLVDSDKIAEEARKRGKTGEVGIALLSPDGLGLGPLPTPQAGGPPTQIAYELFSSDSYQQSFIFFDARTGRVVLDSSTP